MENHRQRVHGPGSNGNGNGNGNGHGHGHSTSGKPPTRVHPVLVTFLIVIYGFMFMMVTGTIGRMLGSGGQVGEAVSLLMIVALPFFVWLHLRRGG